MAGMESAQRVAETKERVLPYPFWVGLAACATPDVQSQLLQTTRAARNAVVQAAPSVSHTTRLASPPAPDTLGLLRTSCRTLPASIVLINDNELFTLREANHIARLIIPQLSCAAITCLSLLGLPEGRGWLVDVGLLQDIHASLPGLRELDLGGSSLPPHLCAYPRFTSLTSVRVEITRDQQPPAMAGLLEALGVRSGAGVAHLTLRRVCKRAAPEENNALNRHIGAVISRVLQDNQLHALRKLSLPDTPLHPSNEHVVEALILNAPALEHLELEQIAIQNSTFASICVPWRILAVDFLHIHDWCGLPLGSRPDQPPLIVRVKDALSTDSNWGQADAAAAHLTSTRTSAGRRQVRLECRCHVYQDSLLSSELIDVLFRVFTLTRFGLSNLVLDGIDSTDDLDGLVGLTSLVVTLDSPADWALETRQMRVGPSSLPQVTSLEVRAAVSSDDLDATTDELWAEVEEDLLAGLPPHITDVRLSDKPSVEQVAEMCVAVSRVPHRQACPLRLCVPGVPGWFGSASRALAAAGIDKAGIVGIF